MAEIYRQSVVANGAVSYLFTGIPAGAKQISVGLHNISFNSDSPLLARIGPVAGVESSGYLGSGGGVESTGSGNNNGSIFRFGDGQQSSDICHGRATLELLDEATNLWVMSMWMSRSESGGHFYGGGSKALAGVLEQIQFLSNGTPTFDNAASRITVIARS